MNIPYMKRFGILAFVFLSLCFIGLTVGCGRVDVNLHTTVTQSGDVIQEISFTGSGMMGGLLSSQMNTDYQKQGWQISTTRSGDSVTSKATKTFSQGDSIGIPGSSTGSDLTKNTKFYVSDHIFVKSYRFETTLIGAAVTSPAGIGELNQQMTEALVNSMFSMAWAITLPGNIVTTNADKIEGDTATWSFTYSSLQKDRYILIESRYINWSAIVGSAAGLFIVVLAAIFIPEYIRARQRSVEY